MNEAAKFLKSTLRLPASKFPPRPPPAEIAKYLTRCDDLYAWQRRKRPATSPDKTFTLHDGPPYANGDLHVGHALNKIVKDMICRYKLAKGYRVDYVPGWDCHGLPIELKALEKHGFDKVQGADAVKVRSAARSFAHNTVKKQMKVFRFWGIMGDWDGHWKTMDKDFELRQLAVFKALAEHGIIYRRHKPVYWSPSSRTALAEAELEYKDDHVSNAAIVKFGTSLDLGQEIGTVHLAIWTTTPWTLPANQAVAVNTDLAYILVRSPTHGNLVVAQSRLPFLEQHLGETLQKIQNLSVHDLMSSSYYPPPKLGAQNSARPIYHADFVKSDSGTGLVHCAPGHGNDDYRALQPMIQSGRVEVKAPVDGEGRFTDEACPENPSLLSGKDVLSDGSAAVLEILKENGALLSSYRYEHSYPIDWRTKKPVIIRATSQWFADISSIKDSVLESFKTVDFIPESGKSRLRSFVENRSEWCISRQRAWGVPIPAIYHKDTGEAVLTSASIDHIMDMINQRGIDAWWSDRIDDPAWIVGGLEPSNYVRGTDTMDVWFDSGSSWTFMTKLDPCQPQTQSPADVYLEGSDQHRGWFQSSILTNIAYQKALNPQAVATAPFKSLITHGFTLDGEGKKMSKSVGNVVSPEQIIEGFGHGSSKTSKKGRTLHSLGPDALRLWAASSDWTKDVVISDQVVANVHKNLDKYRVTMKLLLGMLSDFDPAKRIDYEQMKNECFELDRFALAQLQGVSTFVDDCFTRHEFHKAIGAINEWIARDLSAFYFESVKDIIYCDSVDSRRRLSAQTTLYLIFFQLQHMLGPVVPLLVEETYDFTPEAIQRHAGNPLERVWDLLPAAWSDNDLSTKLKQISVIDAAVKAAQEKARAEKLIGQSLASDIVIALRNPEDLLLDVNTLREALVVSNVQVRQVSNSHFKPDVKDASQNTVESIHQALSVAEAKQNEYLWAFAHLLENYSTQPLEGYVLVLPPGQNKCARCWRYLAVTPIEETNEPALCQRCEDVVGVYKKT